MTFFHLFFSCIKQFTSPCKTVKTQILGCLASNQLSHCPSLSGSEPIAQHHKQLHFIPELIFAWIPQAGPICLLTRLGTLLRSSLGLGSHVVVRECVFLVQFQKTVAKLRSDHKVWTQPLVGVSGCRLSNIKQMGWDLLSSLPNWSFSLVLGMGWIYRNVFSLLHLHWLSKILHFSGINISSCTATQLSNKISHRIVLCCTTYQWSTKQTSNILKYWYCLKG